MPMKKVLPFILILCIVFSACGGASAPGDSYRIVSATLDGEEVSGVTGGISLRKDGTARFTFNGSSCSASWQEEPFSVQFGGIAAEGRREGENLILQLGDSGLEITLSHAAAAENAAVPVPEEPAAGTAYEGRLRYSGCEGIWEDYEGVSMAVSGQLREGLLELFSPYYSEDLPMISLTFGGTDCLGGYVMAYPMKAFDVISDVSIQDRESVNSTEFLNPEMYVWYVPPVVTPEPQDPVEVWTLSGTARDSQGAFDFEIVLTEGNS